MENIKLKLLTVFLIGLGLTEVYAQKVISTTGGNASGSGGTATYSVGQVVYSTNTGSNGSVAHGVQQPYEISVTTGFEEVIGINLEFTAYPNPTKDFLTLKVENYYNKNLSYQLYDISGKLLETKKIESNETSIAMSNLEPSIYFLKVTGNNKEVKTFKIIKN